MCNNNSNANSKTTYGVSKTDYDKMTHDERDKVYTAFLIRQGLDKKHGLQLDPAKGTCRLGERVNGKFVRCMKQHDGSRCPLKDKYDINILSVDLVENSVVTEVTTLLTMAKRLVQAVMFKTRLNKPLM